MKNSAKKRKKKKRLTAAERFGPLRRYHDNDPKAEPDNWVKWGVYRRGAEKMEQIENEE